MTNSELSSTGAEAIRWNLNDLYSDETRLRSDLKELEATASKIASEFRGRVAELGAKELSELFRRLERVHDAAGRAMTYAYLSWSTDTETPARGALLQHVREAVTRIGQELLFVDVEWARMPEEQAKTLQEDGALSWIRHYLELKTESRDHVLSEPEEAILSEKSVTGRSAWSRFFDETLGASRFQVNGEALTLEEALTRLHEPDRETREAAHGGIAEKLDELKRPLTYVFNTVLADKASTDRLRGYESWIDDRNEDNEIDSESVNALIEAVTGCYDLVARYYRLKKGLLGLDEMRDYDRYAPIGEAEQTFSWDQARSIVLDAYGAFSSEMAGIAERFFSDRWIDAPPIPGKRGGAFSHGAVPSAHPYIMLNFTGKVRDVQTLAHELGHGIHQYLSRGQGVFQADTPLTTAETASVFGEMLTFQSLLSTLESDEDRLALLVHKIDDSMATVFRQVSMNRFEDRIHTHRREKGELPPEQFGEHWIETQAALYQDSVTLTDEYQNWWSYIPHFVHTPGYVYAYAFGELLVLALYAIYEQEGRGFADRYVELLRAGGSNYPHQLVKPLGIDLKDPAFWNNGLDAIEKMVADAETLGSDVEE